MRTRVPSKEHADGMLAALKRSHTCGEACTALRTFAWGTVQLKCPLTQLDTSTAVDRKIVQSLYVEQVREVMAA